MSVHDWKPNKDTKDIPYIRRVFVPEFELSSNPTIHMADVKNRLYFKRINKKIYVCA